MSRDKQLRGVTLQAVRLKRDRDQALNVKEFAVLAGFSYSVARQWFQLPGFPVIQGKVFWQDFVLWRRDQNQPNSPSNIIAGQNGTTQLPSSLKPLNQLPARAARILSDVR